MKKPSATRIVDERTKYSTKSGCRRMHSGPAINRCCSARPGYQFACCYRPATSYTCLFLKIRTVSSAEFPVSVCGRNSLLEATKKIKPFVFCFVLYFEEKLSHLKWKWILYFPLVGPYMEAKNWDGTVVRFHWNFIHFNESDLIQLNLKWFTTFRHRIIAHAGLAVARIKNVKKNKML
jgi:hypothetical protein